MEKILCAAIHYIIYPNCFQSIGHPVKNHYEYPGLVLCGFRHCNVISQFYALTQKAGDGDHQGFLTSEGRFVNRRVAWKIAVEADQVSNINETNQTEWPTNKELYSEDLY